MSRTRWATGLSTVLAASALLVGTTAGPAAAAPAAVPVVSGLGGPLHVSWSAGSLLVADTFSGRLLQVDPASGRSRVIRSGVGLSSVSRASDGRILGVIGAGDTPVPPPSLVTVSTAGVKQVADLKAYEQRNNPDGQPFTDDDADSNPYDVLALPGRTLVADAAGNDILSVADNGKVSTLTVLPVSRKGPCANATNNGVPNGGCDPVPTSLAVGPDGFLYVSGLGAEVEGHVWKIEQSSGRIVAHWSGFPPLTGIAVGDFGAVYVSSIFANKVFRLSSTGAISGAVDVAGPTGLALNNGQLYAGSLVFSETGPPSGSVVRLPVSAFYR